MHYAHDEIAFAHKYLLLYICILPGLSGAYYNEWFLRGKPELLGSVKRDRLKGTGSKAAYDPDHEPDFYHMPWLPELLNCSETSVSSITKGSSLSNPERATRKPASVVSSFERGMSNMSIPSKVAIPSDLGLNVLADGNPSIVTPVAGKNIFDEDGNMLIPPLPASSLQGKVVDTSSVMPSTIKSFPPLDLEEIVAPEPVAGIDPVPLTTEAESYSTNSFFASSTEEVASRASIPSSLHVFAQDSLSTKPSSSLFRSSSFSSLLDSSGHKRPREVSTSTKAHTCSNQASVLDPNNEPSNDLHVQSCDDCSSICSEESMQKFLESILDNDFINLNEHPETPPKSFSSKKKQDASLKTAVRCEKPDLYAEV